MAHYFFSLKNAKLREDYGFETNISYFIEFELIFLDKA